MGRIGNSVVPFLIIGGWSSCTWTSFTKTVGAGLAYTAVEDNEIIATRNNDSSFLIRYTP